MKQHHRLCEQHCESRVNSCICQEIEQARAEERKAVVKLAITLQARGYSDSSLIDTADLIDALNESSWKSMPYWEE